MDVGVLYEFVLSGCQMLEDLMSYVFSWVVFGCCVSSRWWYLIYGYFLVLGYCRSLWRALGGRGWILISLGDSGCLWVFPCSSRSLTVLYVR